MRLSKLVLTLLISIYVTSALAAGINWQSYSRSAFEKAERDNRKVLLFGMAPWCPWCRRMKSNVFTDSTVINLINKYYVPVIINIDNEQDTANRYQMTGVPINIILDSKYKVLDSKMGYIDANDMASFLRNNAS